MAKKILMADDEAEIRALVGAMLRGKPQYEYLQACDGVEALEVARREKPDLVFMDIRMPNMGGFEACRRIKADPATSHTIVFMLTALAQEGDVEQGSQAGADGYITKPFSPMALLQQIEGLLAER